MAVVTVYAGGFIYDEVGPLFYALALTLIASMPLLLKVAFWRKLILMLPLLILRVAGKLLLKVFGRNALSRLLLRYGLLEQRLSRVLIRVKQSRTELFQRWQALHANTRGYLVLIFLPVVVVVLLLTLVIRIIRLRFLQILIEKIMQFGLEKITRRGARPGSDQDKSLKD